MTGRKLIVSSLALALLQIGFLSWIIAGRAAVLRNGTEILLRVEPVDPRDLLRGDYVSLGYEISRIPVKLIADLPPDATSIAGGRLLVRLKKGGDGYWHPIAAYLGIPPSTPGSDEADIAGQIAGGWSLAPEDVVAPSYGIDRFYLPEGEGIAIQNDMRVRPFGVKVALARDGSAQIKALVDGDKTLFQEPLY